MARGVCHAFGRSTSKGVYYLRFKRRCVKNMAATSNISKERWSKAHRLEKRAYDDTEYNKKIIELRKYTWGLLIDSLKTTIDFKNHKNILEIGGGVTTVFLAIADGEKYAVDPVYNHVFTNYPYLKEIEEYKDVNFISGTLEDIPIDKKFDLIFSINMLDHVRDCNEIAAKIGKLLSPGGILILSIDCYDSASVRNIIRWFDVDTPHPHHFIKEDIMKLFSNYELIRLDRTTFEIDQSLPDKDGINHNLPQTDKKNNNPKIYRIDIALSRAIKGIESNGEKSILFAVRYLLCYSLATLTAFIIKPKIKIFPLKKPWLFVLQKAAG